jgi:hypothetical protein
MDTYKFDDVIKFEGDTYRVIGVGYTDPESGKTYYHLASTTRFSTTRNGKYPVQVAVWLSRPTSVLYDYMTGSPVREATEEERIESESVAEYDGGWGVIVVEGALCYVASPVDG